MNRIEMRMCYLKKTFWIDTRAMGLSNPNPWMITIAYHRGWFIVEFKA